MKKVFRLCMKALLVSAIFTLLLSGAVFADGPGPGPAPESGDGVPDGPDRWGTDRPDGSGSGPAPNSGDGIPDGSGF